MRSERDRGLLVLGLGRAALRRGPRVEELHALGDQADRLAALAVAALPLVPVEAPVDGDRPTLREEARARLPARAEDRHVGEVGPLVGLAGLPFATGRVARC